MENREEFFEMCRRKEVSGKTQEVVGNLAVPLAKHSHVTVITSEWVTTNKIMANDQLEQ